MRIGCWNIGSLFEAQPEVNKLCLVEICRTIRKTSLDIICLQEILVENTTIDCIEIIKQETSLKYHCSFKLSDSSKGKMGIAIVSRYKIASFNVAKLENPNIEYYNVEREVNYVSHDKGFIIADINYNGHIIKVACGHMLPFHSFGRDSIDFKYLYQEAFDITAAQCKGKSTIICGDFNTSKLLLVAPDFYSNYNSAFELPTRANGNQNDYMFFSDEWDIINYSVIPGEMDHHFCYCEATIKKANKMGTTLLHLSDIHLLHKNTNIDIKDELTTVKDDNRINLFRDIIKSLNKCPDYVIITGDITTKGESTGFHQFNELIFDLIKSGDLPPVDHFIVTPGNHDTLNSGDRWKGFLSLLDSKCIRPWFNSIDPSTDEIKHLLIGYLNENKDKSFLGKIENKLFKTSISFPFLLDVDNELLIYTFNSSIISGTPILLDQSLNSELEILRNNLDNNGKKTIDSILKKLDADPARILPQEISLFESIMELVRPNYRNFDRYKKIAIMHHHTTSISCMEEIKKYDNILNAGYFKRKLIENGFSIVMHGHKHWPLVFSDTAISGGGRLLTMSGGSILGETNNVGNGFYVHELCGDKTISSYYELEAKTIVSNIEMRLNELDDAFMPSLSILKYQIESKLLENLNIVYYEKENVQQYGWSKILDHSRVGSIATAYGLKILEELKCTEPYYLHVRNNIIESLWRFKLKNSGWNALTQYYQKGSLEATIWVIQAFRACKSNYLELALDTFYEMLDSKDANLNNNYTITLAINLISDIDPESPKLQELVDLLLGRAIYSGKLIKYWTHAVDSKDKRTSYTSSPVHTAHAVYTLYKVQRYCEFNCELDELLKPAIEMLTNEKHWNNKEEAIYEVVSFQVEDKLIVKHYTLCWVIKALLEAGINPREKVIQNAIRRLFEDYHDGCWSYNGEYHIWAIYDALTAILTYHKYI